MTTRTRGEFSELASSVRRWLAVARPPEALEAQTATLEPQPRHQPDRAPATVREIPLRQRRELATKLSRSMPAPGEESAHRVALLMDAETTDVGMLPHVVEAVHTAYGVPALSRAYGEWTAARLPSWADTLQRHGVQPIHTFRAASGAAVVALCMDALDVVRDGGITHLVLVGRLAPALPVVARLRAGGTHVVAIADRQDAFDLRHHVDEIVDVAELAGGPAEAASGRHRAEPPLREQRTRAGA